MRAEASQALLEEVDWLERFLEQNTIPLAAAEWSERRRCLAHLRARLAVRRPLPRGDCAVAAARWLLCFQLLCMSVGNRDWGLRTVLWAQLMLPADLSWRAVRIAYLPQCYRQGGPLHT
jgi:hypothetical protein